MPALGDGRLRGERIKEPEITGKQPKKRSFTQTEPAVKDVEQQKLFSQEALSRSQISTQRGLRRALQGKDRLERQTKRTRVLSQLEHQPRFQGQTLLEQMAVSRPVGLDYMARYQEFLRSPHALGRNLQDPVNFDEAFAGYLNDMFLEGRDISEASKSFAAALDANAGFSLKQFLPRSRRCLQGWSKLDPGNTRPPLSWALVALLALGMAKEGKIREALALVLMFTCYLRPGEAVMLLEEDLVAPGGGLGNYALNLHPSDRQELSKVGLTDETILLDTIWISKRLGTTSWKSKRFQKAPWFCTSFDTRVHPTTDFTICAP